MSGTPAALRHVALAAPSLRPPMVLLLLWGLIGVL